MSDYQLTKRDSIIRNSDGACIPADPGNADYAAYLAWVADGHAPVPADLLSREELNAPVLAQIVAIEANEQPRAQRDFALRGDATRLKAIDDRIAALRDQLVKQG